MATMNLLKAEIAGTLGAIVGDPQKGDGALKTVARVTAGVVTVYTLPVWGAVFAAEKAAASALSRLGYKPPVKTQRQYKNMSTYNQIQKTYAEKGGKASVKTKPKGNTRTGKVTVWLEPVEWWDGGDVSGSCSATATYNVNSGELKIDIGHAADTEAIYLHAVLGLQNGKDVKSWYKNGKSIKETVKMHLVDGQKYYIIAWQNVRVGWYWESVGYVCEEVEFVNS